MESQLTLTMSSGKDIRDRKRLTCAGRMAERYIPQTSNTKKGSQHIWEQVYLKKRWINWIFCLSLGILGLFPDMVDVHSLSNVVLWNPNGEEMTQEWTVQSESFKGDYSSQLLLWPIQ